jgi:hypothetical protein
MRARHSEPSLIGEKSPAALFSDISFVYGGKKRGFCRLARRVATPGRRFRKRLDLVAVDVDAVVEAFLEILL